LADIQRAFLTFSSDFYPLKKSVQAGWKSLMKRLRKIIIRQREKEIRRRVLINSSASLG